MRKEAVVKFTPIIFYIKQRLVFMHKTKKFVNNSEYD